MLDIKAGFNSSSKRHRRNEKHYFYFIYRLLLFEISVQLFIYNRARLELT